MNLSIPVSSRQRPLSILFSNTNWSPIERPFSSLIKLKKRLLCSRHLEASYLIETNPEGKSKWLQEVLRCILPCPAGTNKKANLPIHTEEFKCTHRSHTPPVLRMYAKEFGGINCTNVVQKQSQSATRSTMTSTLNKVHCGCLGETARKTLPAMTPTLTENPIFPALSE